MKEILFAPPPQKGIFTLWTRFSVYYFSLFWSNFTILSFCSSSLIYSHSVATLKLLLIWKQFYNFGLFSYAVFNSLFIQNHFYDFFTESMHVTIFFTHFCPCYLYLFTFCMESETLFTFCMESESSFVSTSCVISGLIFSSWKGRWAESTRKWSVDC